MKLFQTIRILRSKNADPFTVTVDIIFKDYDTYMRVKETGSLNAERVAEAYKIPRDRIIKIVFYDQALAVKITMLREIPSGYPGSRDVYGCQQHVPLLNLDV